MEDAMTYSITIFTDFGIPCTNHHATLAEARENGRNALMNLGCASALIRQDGEEYERLTREYAKGTRYVQTSAP